MKKLKYLLLNLDKILIVLLFITITFILIFQTFGRLFYFSFSWTQEFASFCFVWLVFIGAALIYKENAHISISFFYNKMPRKIRIILFYFRNILMLATLIILLKPALDYAIRGLRISASAMQIPMFFMEISVFVGFILLIFQITKKALKGFEEKKSPKPVQEN